MQAAAWAQTGKSPSPSGRRKSSQSVTPIPTGQPAGPSTDGSNIPSGDGGLDLENSSGDPRDIEADAQSCGGAVQLHPRSVYEEVLGTATFTDKDGKRTTQTIVNEIWQVHTMMCGGKPFATVRKCVGGQKPCPPKHPRRVSLKAIIGHGALRSTLTLPMPRMQFTPEESTDAPIVGLPMFYGINEQQWNDIPERELILCFVKPTIDCVVLNVKAKPIAVKLDTANAVLVTNEPENPNNHNPNNTIASTPKKTIQETCQRPIPEVHNFTDAKQQGRDCAVVFQNSGYYPAMRMGIKYNIVVNVVKWTLDETYSESTTSMQANVWRTFTLNIKQFQPVLKRK
jgi:hypothetical protein